VWDRAVEQTVEYRQRWNVQDAEHPVGTEPHGTDVPLEQRRAWRHATQAVGRLRELDGDQTDRTERGDQRQATGRSDHQSDHAKATGRSDRRGDHRSDHERAAGSRDYRGRYRSDRDQERAM
jgi:hypothetical protein